MIRITKQLAAAGIFLGAGIFIAPAVAQNIRGMMDHDEMMGGKGDGTMRGDGMMSRGTGGGCMQMMPGMGNSGRPNEQRRRPAPSPNQGS
jgi:hypothetical protein